MKYLLIGCFAYAIVVAETTWPIAATFNGLVALAAVTLALIRIEASLIAITAIGFCVDATHTGQLLGTNAICFLLAAYLVRAVVSNLNERPLHVACVAGLAYVAIVQALQLLIATRGTLAGVDWEQASLRVGCAWLATVVVVGSIRAVSWVANKARSANGANGAVGSPVGLSVN